MSKIKLAKLKKEDFELMSHKDITNLILEENGKMNTKELFTKIIEFLELPNKVIEEKIADYYTTLTTDKRFILLEDGCWDLRSRHTSDKVVKDLDDLDEEELEEPLEKEEPKEEIDEEEYDVDFDSDSDDDEDDLKDLIVLDEDELELDE